MLKENGFLYCPHCASQSLEFGSKNIYCRDCNYTFYQNTATGAGAIIYRKSPEAKEVLLTVRAYEPERGRYDLPGGFIDPCESLEEGLKRELIEELGPDLAPKLKPLRYLCSGSNIYHYKQIQYPVCDVFFCAELAQDALIRVADDVGDYIWCPVGNIHFEQMAFESTRKALRTWLAEP